MNWRKRNNEIVDLFNAKRLKLNQIEARNNEIEKEIMELKIGYNELNYATNLPSDLMALVLAELPLSCLLTCEQVCTRWNEHVRSLKTKKAVFASVEERKLKKWRHSNELCHQKSTVVQNDFQLSFKLENSLLTNFRWLKIDNKYDDHRSDQIVNRIFLKDLDLVNKLTRLEVLEINKIEFKEEHTITLPNLSYLAIDRVYSKLKLTTPKLSSYQTKAMKNVAFVYSEKITHLYLGSELDTALSELRFPNLEHLCLKVPNIRKRSCLTEWDQFFAIHPNLKTFSMRPCLKRLDKSTYASVNSLALHILETKKTKQNDLKIVFFGIRLENASRLENYRYRKNLVKLQLQNFSRLCADEKRWFKQLNYSSVMNHFDNDLQKIPDTFFETFKFVSEIYVSDMKYKHDDARRPEEDRLIEFLKKFKNIQSFKVLDSKLSDSFYSQLSTLHPNIWRLDVQVDDCWDFYAYNFLEKFIFDFKNLYHLSTNFYEDGHVVKDLLRKFDNIFCFTFEYSNDGCRGRTTIEHKSEKSPYRLYYKNRFRIELKNLEDLLSYLYEHYNCE